MADCLRYAMSLPVAIAIVGMADPRQVEQNASVARDFRPMPLEERRALERKAGAEELPRQLWWKHRS